MRHVPRVALSLTLAVALAAPAAAARWGLAEPALTPEGATALAQALSRPAEFVDRGPQAFRGRVGTVCQKKGCWMMLIDGERSARVMTGYRFTLPTELSGEAVVWGHLIERQLDARSAEHFARESGGAPVAAGVEYRIDAFAIHVADAP